MTIIKKIIERFASGNPSREVRDAFGEWLVKDDRQQAKEDALYRIWMNLCSEDLSDSTRERRMKLEMLHRHTGAEKRKSRLLWRCAGIAAAVVVLLAGGFLLNHRMRAPQAVCILTADNARGHHILPDGTSVWLNSGSTLRYAQDMGRTGSREVFLEGEGYFDVVHDGTPFCMKTSSFDVQVLGTQFCVRQSPLFNEDQVTVASGSVQVGSAGTAPVVLSPGEQYVMDKGSGESCVRKVDTADYLSWFAPIMVMDNLPLSKVLEKLEHRYNVKVSVGRGVDTLSRLSLKVSDETKERVFSVIGILTNTEVCYIDDKHILLTND